jgi:hypothetical protein
MNAGQRLARQAAEMDYLTSIAKRLNEALALEIEIKKAQEKLNAPTWISQWAPKGSN